MLKNTPIIFLFIIVMYSFTGFSQNQDGVIQIDSSQEVNTLIQRKISFNKEHHYIDGYRIQLFYGSESGVRNIRNKFVSLFPQTSVYVDYESPDWKIRVGDYKTRIEADKAFQEIILEFGGAFVLSYKINPQF